MVYNGTYKICVPGFLSSVGSVGEINPLYPLGEGLGTVGLAPRKLYAEEGDKEVLLRRVGPV